MAFASATFAGSNATLRVADVGRGWVARPVVVPSDPIAGFAVAGADGKFVPAKAPIAGPSEMVVHSPQLTAPVAVRYARAGFPMCNLFADEHWPDGPVRTDHFEPVPARAGPSK